jgi:hypothetical protein
MDKIDFSDIQTPAIRNISHAGGELDEIQIKSNIWLKVQDKMNNSDYAYIPIEFELNFEAKTRKGIRLMYGWTQEVKSSFKNVSIKMKECQGVYR